MNRIVHSVALLAALLIGGLTTHAKKIVMVAGEPSHGILQHEYNAGCLLLKKCLSAVPDLEIDVHLNGWPKDRNAFDGADAIFLFMTGGDRHPAIQGDRLAQLQPYMDRGVGFAAAHYAVEGPKERGGKEFLEWMGGYFEMHYSVNPHWDAEFDSLPDHPITNGVESFTINDEWYFHMRFQPGMEGVTPVLSAIAPESTMERPDGPHSGNPHVRKSVAAENPQHVAWAYERPNGGRGFGFTGAHNHLNWGNQSFRKIMLNALLWIAKIEVPEQGVECDITETDLMKNLDPKRGRKPRPAPRAEERRDSFVSPVIGSKSKE